jgi:hypothetical protein
MGDCNGRLPWYDLYKLLNIICPWFLALTICQVTTAEDLQSGPDSKRLRELYEPGMVQAKHRRIRRCQDMRLRQHVNCIACVTTDMMGHSLSWHSSQNNLQLLMSEISVAQLLSVYQADQSLTVYLFWRPCLLKHRVRFEVLWAVYEYSLKFRKIARRRLALLSRLEFAIAMLPDSAEADKETLRNLMNAVVEVNAWLQTIICEGWWIPYTNDKIFEKLTSSFF